MFEVLLWVVVLYCVKVLGYVFVRYVLVFVLGVDDVCDCAVVVFVCVHGCCLTVVVYFFFLLTF